MSSNREQMIKNQGAKLAIQYTESNIQLVGIGLQLFMCFYGLIVFLETPRSHRKGGLSLLYIVVSFTILSLSLMTVIPDNYARYLSLYHADPGDPQQTKAAMDQYGGNETPQYGVSRIASTFIAFIGDGLLLYRCYFFWSDRKLIVILPALTYLASVRPLYPLLPLPLTATHLLLVMGFLQMLWPEAFPGWRIEFSVAWIILTACLNVIITFLISLRLLVAARRTSQLLPSFSSRVYTSIVAILVEAALPLSLTGIVLAGFINQSRGAGASRPHQGVFKILYFFFLAISPQMIIFRVMTGRGFLKDGSSLRAPRTTGSGAATKPMSTALDFARSEMDSETRGTVHSAGLDEKYHEGTVGSGRARSERVGRGGGEGEHV